MSEYTRKQREAISLGWSHLSELCSRQDYRAAIRLKAALREEKRERSSHAVAQALVCDAFLSGWDCPETAAHDLYAYSDGLQVALVIGAHARKAWGLPADAYLNAIEAAVHTHDVAQAERMAALKQ